MSTFEIRDGRLRDASVKRCHDRGGQAITQEWWQGEDFWKVKCVQ